MSLFQVSILTLTVFLIVVFVQPPFLLSSASAAVVPASSTSNQSRQTATGAPEISVSGAVAFYSGEMTTDGLLRLRELAANRKLTTLIIKSGGGAVSAGIEFGNWVYDHKLDVTVKEGCFSSCANYVFPAGKKKIILPGAIVAWHGSVLQRNFQTEANLRKEIEETHSQENVKVSAEQIDKEVKKSMSELQLLKEKQAAFYQRIGVDEYITRIGQEEYGAKGFYFLSVEDMKRFGITDVTAPDDYPNTDLTELKRRIKVSLIYVKLKAI